MVFHGLFLPWQMQTQYLETQGDDVRNFERSKQKKQYKQNIA
jgi:hypothetical protein